MYLLSSYIITCQILIVFTMKFESSHIQLLKPDSKKFRYHLKTTVFGKSHHLKLQRLSKLNSQVFSPNFKMETKTFNSKTNTVSSKTVPISKKFKNSLIENIYWDPSIPGSHISITKNFINGDFILKGFLSHDKVIQPGLFGNHTIIHNGPSKTENVQETFTYF